MKKKFQSIPGVSFAAYDDADIVKDDIAATLLNSTPGTLKYWDNTGRHPKLKSIKIGRSRNYMIGNLKEFIVSKMCEV